MITTSEMKELEDLSEKYGVSKLKLMENAGHGLFLELKKRYDMNDKKILVLCGHGNNGGDGFVLARYLYDERVDVKVLFLEEKQKLKKESGYNYYRLLDGHKGIFTNKKDFSQYDIIVDAMLGTGIKGKIREPYASAIDLVNESKKTIVAVDIPSGLDPDTGIVLDKAVEADLIITFHDIKPGLVKLHDKVIIVDIGIPEEAINDINNFNLN